MNTRRVWAVSLGILGLLLGLAGCDYAEPEPEDNCLPAAGALVASESVAPTIDRVTGEGPCSINCAGSRQPCERYTISTEASGTCTFTVEFTNGPAPKCWKWFSSQGRTISVAGAFAA